MKQFSGKSNVIQMSKHEYKRESTIEKGRQKRERIFQTGSFVVNKNKEPDVPKDLKEYPEKIRAAIMEVREESKERFKVLEKFKEGKEVFCIGLIGSSRDILVKYAGNDDETEKLKILDIAAKEFINIHEKDIDCLDEITEKNINDFEFILD